MKRAYGIIFGGAAVLAVTIGILISPSLETAKMSSKSVTTTKREAPSTPVSAEQALDRLMAGNRRYVGQRMTHPRQTASRRTELASGQQPMAVVLSCSDSRVPPEVIFDQGLGDVFVIRVAGEVTDQAGLGSMEYALDHLGPRLLLVLGHSKCGAVAAALQASDAPGHVGYLVRAIAPAVAEVRGQPGDELENAVRANVRLVVRQLTASDPVISKLVQEKKVKVAGAAYNLATGNVEILK